MLFVHEFVLLLPYVSGKILLLHHISFTAIVTNFILEIYNKLTKYNALFFPTFLLVRPLKRAVCWGSLVTFQMSMSC